MSVLPLRQVFGTVCFILCGYAPFAFLNLILRFGPIVYIGSLSNFEIWPYQENLKLSRSLIIVYCTKHRRSFNTIYASMNISEYNIWTVNVTKYKQTYYICPEVELNGRYIWRNSPVNLIPLSSSSPLQWPAMPRKDLLLHLLVPWQVQEKLHSTCLCMYF